MGEAYAPGAAMRSKGANQEEGFYDLAETWLDTMAGSFCLVIRNEEDMEFVRERNPRWYQTMVDGGIERLVLFPLILIGLEKLIREDRSGTTRENFQNTWAIIEDRGGTEKPLAVITSEFHMARARYIAGTLGLETCPVAARTDQWYFRWNYTLREVFAFVKARLDAN